MSLNGIIFECKWLSEIHELYYNKKNVAATREGTGFPQQTGFSAIGYLPFTCYNNHSF